MYRLPNQFDPAPRNSFASAAGGGCSSTCCSSCVITLVVSCVVPAALFSRIIDGRQVAPAGAPDTDGPPPRPTGAAAIIPIPAPERGMPSMRSRLGWGLLGLLAYPLTLLLLGTLFLGLKAGPASLATLALPVLLSMGVYAKTGRSPRRGLIIGIVLTVLFTAAAIGEAIVWPNMADWLAG